MSAEFDKNISVWRYDCTDHRNGFDFFMKLVKWSILNAKNHPNLSEKKISLKNINLGARFLFLLISCSIKIERLLFLKFLKNLAFFDSYFWPFNESEEKIKIIFVISAVMPLIGNVFIKFHWHDEKLTAVAMQQKNRWCSFFVTQQTDHCASWLFYYHTFVWCLKNPLLPRPIYIWSSLI